MEKDWPPLEECPQYRFGLMEAALFRYPWEEDGYAFDFDSFYPPIPDEPPFLRKLLESTRGNKVGVVEENTENCPLCHPHVDLPPGWRLPFPKHMCFPPYFSVESMGHLTYLEIGEHPVWDMDPIPCPFHILSHLYGYGQRSSVDEPFPSLVTPEELESTKKFLKELRASRGYQVESIPHRGLVDSLVFAKKANLDAPICNGNGRTSLDLIKEALDDVIDHISFKTGKSFQLVEVLKVISTMPLYLLTFSAAAPPAPSQIFIATLKSLRPTRTVVNTKFPPNISNPNILECLVLPNYEAPISYKPWVIKLQQDEMRKRQRDYKSILQPSMSSMPKEKSIGIGNSCVYKGGNGVLVIGEEETKKKENEIEEKKGKSTDGQKKKVELWRKSTHL